jgi:hypothetical protein
MTEFKINLSIHSSVEQTKDGKLWIRFFTDREEVGREALVVGLRTALFYLTGQDES